MRSAYGRVPFTYLTPKFDNIMATIKVILRLSSHDSNEGTLFYRVIHKRKTRQIHTGYRLKIDEWDVASGKMQNTSNQERADYLKTVQSKLDNGMTRINRIVASFEKTGGDFTVDDIINAYNSPEAVVGFLSFARKHISDLRQMGKIRLSEHYTTSLNSFVRFHGDEELAFEEVDCNLIGRYESYLKGLGHCPNTTSYYMRNLRAIYNRAAEQDYTPRNNPFKHVYTGVAKTVKRAVSLTNLKALRDLDLSDDPMAALARNLFLFSFYTRGMTIIDMAYLRKSNLKNGVLSYRRQKTGQYLTIRWEPQMQEIAVLYANSENDFMFPLIDSGKPDFRKQYLRAYDRLIKRLKKLGAMLGLTEPLTFHRSRHGWASIARDNNVPLSIISEGMGHDSEKTTRIYLASLDTSVVDNANSNILSLLDS